MALNEGRRPQLKGLKPESPHPGLWLDRYLTHQTWQDDRSLPGYDKVQAQIAKDSLIDEIQQKPVATDYRLALADWERSLERDTRVACAVAKSLGRVIVGIGQKGPAEFGITLHRTWGVPVLPGSSLKGIAALGADRYLGEEWRRRDSHAQARKEGPNAYDALFGDVEEQGAVIFHDAWFHPTPDGKNGLHRDVLTVHHPVYYQKDGEPTDLDSPIPVPFVSASGDFLIAIELHPSLDPVEHAHWLEAAWRALQLGLSRHGLGSKTNAGYGRVELPDYAATSAAKRKAQQAAALAAERDRAEAQERERRLRDEREPLPPGARVAHVTRHDGFDALLGWLRSSGSPPLIGLTFDEPHVGAAAAELYAANKAGGVASSLSNSAKTWWINGLAPAPAGPPTARAFGANSEDPSRWLKDKRFEPDRFARRVATGGFNEPTVRAAIAHLKAHGAKPGHLRILANAYPIDDAS